ncbi:MAG: A24 family peptidase [Bacillota bacterium]|nr:A24 family peptidase [Bacillota bacterium]
MVIIIIKIALSIMAGVLAGPAAVYVFNHVPGQWLCDYGENPVERSNVLARARRLSEQEVENIQRSLVDPDFRRIKENPWRWIFAAGFICICLSLSLQAGNPLASLQAGDSQLFSMQLALAGLLVCWALLLIALSDQIYMIIPDQFLLILLLAGAGMLPIHAKAMEAELGKFMNELTGCRFSCGMLAAIYILAGIVIGVLLMLLVALLGKIISGEAALGMGDIKLYAVLGFAIGACGTVFVFLLSTLTAGIAAGLGLAKGKNGRRDHRPLGPHICIAAVIYIFIILPFTL